jgi:hypothetical protein
MPRRTFSRRWRREQPWIRQGTQAGERGTQARPVRYQHDAAGTSGRKGKKAVAKGEQLDFSSREPDSPTKEQGRVERKRQQTPMRSIYIKGPESVLERFIDYTNRLGVDAYWQALEKLLNDKA